MKEIAGFLNMNLKDFKKKYTQLMFVLGRVLKFADTNGCVFLFNNKCRIYEARPEQCRTFPFWKRIMKNSKDKAHVAEYCKELENCDKW